MVKIFTHFKKVWEAYKTNFVPLALSILILGITLIFFFGAGFFALLGTEGTTEIANSYMISGEPIDFESAEFLDSINLENLWIFFLFLILGVVVAVFLQAGFLGLCLSGIKKKVTMKTFFSTIRERGISYFFATLLILLIVIAIFSSLTILFVPLFLYMPSVSPILIAIYLVIILLIVPFFVLIPPAIIEGKSVFDSFSQSFRLGKKHYLDLLLLMIFIYVVSFVSLIPVVGILLLYFLIVPIFTLVICSFYLEVSVKKVKSVESKTNLGVKEKTVKKKIAKKSTKKKVGKTRK